MIHKLGRPKVVSLKSTIQSNLAKRGATMLPRDKLARMRVAKVIHRGLKFQPIQSQILCLSSLGRHVPRLIV